MPSTRIDRDEYEATRAELIDRMESRDGDLVVTVGNHEDHGRVTLRRDEGVFTIAADSLEFVRPWGVPAETDD